MVSIVLLTTEEVLERNQFWYCLDTLWTVEELEPFEEIKYEHVFAQPLSRDIYYAKYPDIPRSESEDENPFSLNGFKNKRKEWQVKICLRKHEAERRNSSRSYLSCNGSRSNRSTSLNNGARRIISFEENQCNEPSTSKITSPTDNDKRVLNFLKRLHENVPPPPIEDLRASLSSIDFDLPAYEEFENNKLQQIPKEEAVIGVTSTLKKSKKKVNFNVNKSEIELEDDESWYDSIYGLSDLLKISENELENNPDTDSQSRPGTVSSWTDILQECDVHYSDLPSNASSTVAERVVSRSNIDTKIEDLEDEDASNEEALYAKFAVYKILQTLKLQGGNMIDSSSMKDLTKTEDQITNKIQRSSVFFGTMYRLAPNSFDDVRISNESESR